MADKEDKKEKKKTSEKLYGKGPKLAPADEKGDTVKSEGGAPEEAAKKAEESAGKPKSETTHSEVGKSGTEAKSGEETGTEGVPTSHTRSGGDMRDEMKDLHAHHERAMKDLHEHHERSMKALTNRHARMGRDAPDAGMEDKEVGESGTNPE